MLHTIPFPLRVFQQIGIAQQARGSLSGSYAEVVDMESLLAWDDGLLASIKSMKGGYPALFGSAEIRRLVADMLELDADDIIITNGVDDAIPGLYGALFESGDHISFLQPTYDPLAENAGACQLTTHSIDLSETESGWQISRQSLQKMISANISACVLNVPHNPTGWFPTQKDMREIISHAEKTNCIVITDEVYAGLAMHPQKPAPPSLASLSDRIISVGSLTKSFGLPGLRIGWIACKNREIIDVVKNRRTYGHCYTSALSEIVACSAIKNKDIILRRNEEIARKNLLALSELITRWRSIFSAHLPDYGTVCLVRFNPSNTMFGNAGELSADLLAKESIVLLDNKFFNSSENWFRFGFATRQFGELLAVFETYLQRHIRNG